MEVLKLEKITKSYFVNGSDLAIVSNVSFSVDKGSFFCMVGPSGCGKTTLLRIIAGLENQNTGKIYYSGDEQRDKDFVITVIFQHFALFPWLTARENIEFGLKMKGVSKQEVKKQVDFFLEKMDLAHFANAYPKELSGGMKQRVGIARALALKPTLLLMDEPFSALDAFTAETLRGELMTLWQEQKMTVVMVTHSVDEAAELADEIIVFTPRPAKVKKIVKNDQARPRNLRGQEFFRLTDELKELVKV